MDTSTKALVQERAGNCCEYCQLHQDDSPLAALHIEHIIPKKHGGSEDMDNLALACIDCNLHKGSNLTGIDPETNEVTELFHPRRWRITMNIKLSLRQRFCARQSVPKPGLKRQKIPPYGSGLWNRACCHKFCNID